MLDVVEELERNGQNLQHFSRELARYFRNLLVAQIAGAETRLIAASAAERERLAEIAARFSEEDLTRYLQLTLDLFSDLQASLQPRLHLEIGLLRLVQAGRLLPIEQALAGIRRRRRRPQPAAAAPVPRPAAGCDSRRAAPTAPRRAAVADAAAPSCRPRPCRRRLASSGCTRSLMELGMPFTADAVEHSRVVEVAGELQFTASKVELAGPPARRSAESREADLLAAHAHQGDRRQPGRSRRRRSQRRQRTEDEATSRALANPEVQRFREVFGGEIRKVRNLKE